jgi:5-methyltetrahydropteroyltriglutamate--homocysteine methyltransferase
MRAMTSTATRTKPFFHADHVGSLLRPPEVLAAREALARGEIDAAKLRAIEDAAIRDVVVAQERVGLPVVTDGEFRRENWYADFIGRLGGVEIREAQQNPAFDHDPDKTVHYVPKNVVTVAPLRRPKPILVDDYAFLADVTTSATAKITIPSPSRLHFHGGRSVVDVSTYPDIEAFFADVVHAYRAEIADLEAAGCRYIQVDDPLARSAWIAEGGYERIAEQLFANLENDHFLLEYDDDRSGDFAPLRFMPKDKRVVLGLVTSKRGELETRETLLRRVDEATQYIPIANLAISPQCGFASVVEGNIITPDDQWAKLKLVVDTAAEIWP